MTNKKSYHKIILLINNSNKIYAIFFPSFSAFISAEPEQVAFITP